MIPIEVLNNLKSYALWDISDYKMNKSEADVCIAALTEYAKLLSVKEIVSDYSVWEEIGKVDYKRVFEMIKEAITE